MNALFDTSITIGLRNRMIEMLSRHFEAQKIIKNYQPILSVMAKMPRHLFLAKGFEALAYQNEAIEIEAEQTISQPLTVAIQTALLDLQPSDNVLEIGTGSGYQASILSGLCRTVYTLERHQVLFNRAAKLLRKVHCQNVKTYFKDGFEGLPIFSPYDKILITCAADEIPQNLISQLKVGGKIVLPLQDGAGAQDMVVAQKLPDEMLDIQNYGKFQFVPMLQGIDKLSV